MEKKKQVLNGLHCLTVNWKDALGVINTTTHSLAKKTVATSFIDGHQTSLLPTFSRTADGTV
jgi:hypothetical protein